jgi:hypothetical protein
MRVLVDGVDTPMLINSLSADNAIGQRSTGSVTLRDDTGAHHYVEGQRVDIVDDAQANLRVFSGVVDDDDEGALEPTSTLTHKLALKDWHYLADKRLAAIAYDAGLLTGDIGSDLIKQYLYEEGVVGRRDDPVFARTSIAYYPNGSTDPYVSSVLSGAPRYEAGAITSSKAIRIEEGTTNLLSANQSDVETNTAGFSAASSTLLSAGATISRDTAHKYANAASLKIISTSGSSGQGAEAQITSLLANTKYAVSAWLDGTTGQTWQLAARDFTNSVQVTQNIVLGGDWTRVTLILTTGALAVTDFRVAIKTASAVAQTVWADGWQVEAKGHVTSWTPGGTPRAAETLKLPAQGGIRPEEGTLQFRAYIDATVKRQEVTNNGGNLFGIDIGPTEGHGGALNLFHSNNSGNWVMNISGSQFPSFADSFTPDGWHSFAVAWDSASLLVYVDGTLRCTQNSPQLSMLFAPYLYIGSNGIGADHAGTLFQDIRISARKRTASEIAADALLTTKLTLDQDACYRTSLDGFLSATSHIADGVSMPDVIFNYCTNADAYDALTRKAGAYWWQIDAYKQVWLQPYAAIAAPWNLTTTVGGVTTDAKTGSVRVKRAKPLYRNTQYVGGQHVRTSSQVEIKKGDGQLTAFTVGYPIAEAPTVEVNIASGGYVTKTVGIKGVNTSGYDWYWNAGEAVITQDTAGVKLTASDLLRITYIGEYPQIVISQDTAEITMQKMLEGGGTSGKVEQIVADASLISATAAFTEAAALLSKYAQGATTLRFLTKRAGLAQGQLIHVTIPRHGLDADMLIESVKLTDQDGQIIWYDVTALLGPVNQSWVQFFGQLARSATESSDTLQVGASSTLVLAADFTATASPTATFVVTVYSCPLLPWTLPVTVC